jgi:predicted transcriptional regulator
MTDEPPAASANQELTTEIVAAYVRRNQVGADQLASLISTVHQALGDLGKPAPEAVVERTPAVSIRRSVQHDKVTCLECGWARSMLRRHLTTAHGLSVERYRARWNLPRDHAMVAPGYSERRSTMAKQFGLGRTRGASAETAAVSETETATATQPSPKRRGRSRSAATPA